MGSADMDEDILESDEDIAQLREIESHPAAVAYPLHLPK